jgi:hypothetical protein
MAAHIRQRRLAAPVPSAFAGKDELRPSEESRGDRDPLLGHNSRGVDIDAEEPQQVAPAPASGGINIDALVSRAATIQSQHVASRRKRLTMMSLRPQNLAGGEPDTK